MKIILRSDIINVGRQGDIKEVSDGYARNFLLPNGKAMEANKANLKLWETEKKKFEKQREKIILDARELASKIEKTSITIPVKVGEANKLFGSVTTSTVAKALEENGFKIEKHDILLPEPIKEVGVFTIELRVHPEVIARAKFWIVEEKEEEPAKSE
jgi:large subunit ribosomal protein L9